MAPTTVLLVKLEFWGLLSALHEWTRVWGTVDGPRVHVKPACLRGTLETRGHKGSFCRTFLLDLRLWVAVPCNCSSSFRDLVHPTEHHVSLAVWDFM